MRGPPGNDEGVRYCWLHRRRGSVWIVALRAGKVVGAMGPFEPSDLSSEVTPLIALDTLDVPWIEADRANFLVCTTDARVCRDGCRPRFEPIPPAAGYGN